MYTGACYPSILPLQEDLIGDVKEGKRDEARRVALHKKWVLTWCLWCWRCLCYSA